MAAGITLNNENSSYFTKIIYIKSGTRTMKDKTALWIAVTILSMVVIYDRFTIFRARKDMDALRQQTTSLKSSLFEFNNLYVSQMGPLIDFLHDIHNDDFVDIREIYNPDVSAMQKLSSFRSLIHRRNRLCEKIIRKTEEYVLYAKNKFDIRDSRHKFYSQVLQEDDNGKLVLKIESVPEFELMNIEKYK
jgi:hypothetical protein